MVLTQGSKSAICTPGSCSSSMLTFIALLTQYLGHSYDEKFQLTNPDDGADEFDFVIVGAGGAGCVVANRLSENKNWKVLLLEEGDEEPIMADIPGLLTLLKASNLASQQLQTQPEPQACATSPDHRCAWARGKVMGGSSTIYSMHFVRGNKWDYDNWANLGNPGWSWLDVLPYFKKSEDLRIKKVLEASPFFHGTGGYQTIEGVENYDDNARVIMDGWKEVGLKEVDYNSGDNLGTSRMQYATIRGSRQSSNGAFIRPIRGNRPNLTVRPNSRVTKVIIDSATKRATGVMYKQRKSGELKRVKARKEVILSAGSIESPKLLMLSGVGPVEELKKSKITVIQDLPVGKNLQNHFSIIPISVSTSNHSIPYPIEKMQDDVVYWLNTHDGIMSVNGFMDNIAFLKTSHEPQDGVPDIQVGYIKFKNDKETGLRVLLPNYDGFLLTTLYLAPKSRGYVTLDPTDPTEKQPLIYPNYFSNPEDIKAIAEGARLTKQLVETDAFKNAGFVATKGYAPLCDKFVYGSFEYYECLAKQYTGTIYHFVGTCKMGPDSDPEAVVDSRLKVKGIEGLRVIDASIFPELTRGNTLAPTIMIAEKCSDLIKKDWAIHN